MLGDHRSQLAQAIAQLKDGGPQAAQAASMPTAIVHQQQQQQQQQQGSHPPQLLAVDPYSITLPTSSSVEERGALDVPSQCKSLKHHLPGQGGEASATRGSAGLHTQHALPCHSFALETVLCKAAQREHVVWGKPCVANKPTVGSKRMRSS